MRSESRVSMSRIVSNAGVACVAAFVVLSLSASASRVEAQTFNSGSDGSDGVYAPSGPPGTIVLFDPSKFTGSQVSANIFNFISITIPAGVTVKLSGNKINGPVFWLAQRDVDIEGTIDLSGGNGHDGTVFPFARVPSMPGSGGYGGGVGGNTTQAPLPGSGPGGGAKAMAAVNAGGGNFSGNNFLIPLVGGSGGGGGFTSGSSYFDNGGGAGGGALLIASSTQITVNGLISANGGAAGAAPAETNAGGGSGGAIRLVSNTVTGVGLLRANGGTSGFAGGGAGIVRLEAYTIALGVQGTLSESTPFPLLLPTAGPPFARVISINGVAINPNPATFPDITINTTSLVPVVIQTHNIPTTATVTLTILDENGVADTVIAPPPPGNCDLDNFCTTSVNVIFPFGPSRGLTKVTWSQ